MMLEFFFFFFFMMLEFFKLWILFVNLVMMTYGVALKQKDNGKMFSLNYWKLFLLEE